MFRGEQDTAFMTDAELFRLRQKDQSYTARLYARVDQLKRDDAWIDETLSQYSARFVPFLKQMEDANDIEAIAIVRAMRHTLEKLANEQATIDVKQED